MSAVIWKISLFLTGLAILASPTWAVSCKDVDFDAQSFTICEVDVQATPPRLFLNDQNGRPYGNFNALPDEVIFAMNAGMYHDDRRPVGHYVEDGVQTMRVIPGAGPGNFGMVPNGVYCIQDGRADVIETQRFLQNTPACVHATQSGPMLVIDGDLHPRFFPESDFTNVRNGVGTSDDGRISYFVISNQRVNFHTFARVFQELLGIDQALYFDGRVSRLYAPELGRNDFGARMGPIVAVVD